MDELEKLWETEQAGEEPSGPIRLKRKKPTSIVGKIYRTLKIENYINIGLLIAALAWIVLAGYELVFGGLLVLLLAPVIGYYFYLLSNINPYSYNSNVHEHLVHSLELFKKFVQRYRVLNYFYIVFAVLILSWVYTDGTLGNLPIEKPVFWVILLAGISIFIAFSETYIYLVYRRKIRHLEKLVSELEE